MSSIDIALINKQ